MESTILTPDRQEMLKIALLVVTALAIARAQVPSLGWCPEYVPMANFDMSKFLGVWYEAERYFQLTEVVSRCVMANYTKGNDGKLRVSNEVTNRFTGIKRVLEGEIRPAASKSEEGKLHVKYTTVPLALETKYAVLETDYKNYAVLWSCSGLGPVNAQNAWLMTRERIPSGQVLQMAYGVLDKYKISKTYFMKTNQEDCAYLDNVPSVEKPIKPLVEPENEVQPNGEAVENNLRSAMLPDAAEIIIQTRKAELVERDQATKPADVAQSGKVVTLDEPTKADGVVRADIIEKETSAEKIQTEENKPAPVTIPEAILKSNNAAKEVTKASQGVPSESKIEIPKKPEPILADVQEPQQVQPIEAAKEKLKSIEKVSSRSYMN